MKGTGNFPNLPANIDSFIQLTWYRDAVILRYWVQKYFSAYKPLLQTSDIIHYIHSWSIYRKSLDIGLLKTFPSTFSRLYASLRWHGRIGPDSFLSFITILAAKVVVFFFNGNNWNQNINISMANNCNILTLKTLYVYFRRKHLMLVNCKGKPAIPVSTTSPTNIFAIPDTTIVIGTEIFCVPVMLANNCFNVNKRGEVATCEQSHLTII